MLHKKLLGVTNALDDIKYFGLLCLHGTNWWIGAAWIWFWSESFVVDDLNWVTLVIIACWALQHGCFMKLLFASVHEAQPFMILLFLIGLCARHRSCYLWVHESWIEDANAVALSTFSLVWVIISAFAIIWDLFSLNLEDLHGVLFDVTFIVVHFNVVMEADQIQISIQKVSRWSFITQTFTLRNITLPRWSNWHRLCWRLHEFSFISLTQHLINIINLKSWRIQLHLILKWHCTLIILLVQKLVNIHFIWAAILIVK